MSRRLELPPKVRDGLLIEMYRQADEMDWDLLGNTEKTSQYVRWIEDPQVGGVLLSYADERRVRVWIKDVAMKEYGRAQEGIGHYVQYAVRRFRGPEEIVRSVCEQGWALRPESVGEKPNHCYAMYEDLERYVCWGRPGSFRDLVWAALNKAIDMPVAPAAVVATRDGETISPSECERQALVTKHCGIELKHLHRALMPNPEYIG
ncbi:hypothetical protein [Nocardiopsis sp. ATB16-24]|uniref:hypothetical protein n=1 Tax=Nocardiopsis sp. ATB16-24 TaxID=3019555 RepID=UPI002557BA90|nr:hypothetical protein [Nocardiopsis sp. ATB16-24]